MAHHDQFGIVLKRERSLPSPSNIADVDSLFFPSIPTKRQKFMGSHPSTISINSNDQGSSFGFVSFQKAGNSIPWENGLNYSAFRSQDSNNNYHIDSSSSYGANQNIVTFQTAPTLIASQHSYDLQHQRHQQQQQQQQQQQHPTTTTAGTGNLNCECCLKPIPVPAYGMQGFSCCAFCDKKICDDSGNSCKRSCDVCMYSFCRNCTTTDYSQPFERIVCIDCYRSLT